MRQIFISIAFLLALVGRCWAQQDGPIVIPEELQSIALELAVPDRLGISWDDASTEDVGRYMGFLAAASVVANEIALGNARKVPERSDYIAGLAVQCAYPTNKPAIVEKYWDLLFPAFYSAGVRANLVKAVRPGAVHLSTLVGGNLDLSPITSIDDESKYFSEVLDLNQLRGAR